MSLLVKLQAYLNESNTPLFFTFLKLYKWYQIAQYIIWKVTVGDKVILNTVLKQKNLLCKQHS